MKTALLLVFLGGYPGGLLAAPLEKKIEKMFDVMQVKRMVDSSLKNVVADYALQSEKPGEAQARLEKVLPQLVGYEALKPRLAKVYAQYLTEKEVDAIIQFFSSPAGKRFAQLQPTLFRDSSDLTQRILAENDEQIRQAIGRLRPPVNKAPSGP